MPRRTPEQRASLEAFRDSIAGTVDSVGLEGLEDQLIAAAKADRNDAMRHLRLGFLALRLGDLGGSGHYDDAASEFQWAIDLEPSWPYAWYGMGLAEYGIGDSQVTVVSGLKTMFGKDALARSAAAFAKTGRGGSRHSCAGWWSLSNTALTAAGQHQARCRARCAAPLGQYVGRDKSRGASGARPGGARGGQPGLGGGRLHALHAD